MFLITKEDSLLYDLRVKSRFIRKKIIVNIYEMGLIIVWLRSKKNYRLERKKVIILIYKMGQLIHLWSSFGIVTEGWGVAGLWHLQQSYFKNNLKNNKDTITFFWHYKTFYSLILGKNWNGICNKVIWKFIFVIWNILLFNFGRNLKMWWIRY